jgi:hypothetical protein
MGDWDTSAAVISPRGSWSPFAARPSPPAGPGRHRQLASHPSEHRQYLWMRIPKRLPVESVRRVEMVTAVPRDERVDPAQHRVHGIGVTRYGGYQGRQFRDAIAGHCTYHRRGGLTISHLSNTLWDDRKCSGICLRRQVVDGVCIRLHHRDRRSSFALMIPFPALSRRGENDPKTARHIRTSGHADHREATLRSEGE